MTLCTAGARELRKRRKEEKLLPKDQQEQENVNVNIILYNIFRIHYLFFSFFLRGFIDIVVFGLGRWKKYLFRYSIRYERDVNLHRLLLLFTVLQMNNRIILAIFCCYSCSYTFSYMVSYHPLILENFVNGKFIRFDYVFSLILTFSVSHRRRRR